MEDRQVSLKAAINAICKAGCNCEWCGVSCDEVIALEALPSAQPTISCDHENDTSSAQPDADKYEYHYDHTDCIWYRPEARNRCPSTCAQYRDGWNDAMQYIFRDGKGYRPYRRGERYE